MYSKVGRPLAAALFVLASSLTAACASTDETVAGEGGLRQVADPRGQGQAETPAFTVTFGDVTRDFDRAHFGFDGPANAPHALYLELYAGGDPGCPQFDSATPKRTLIVSGVKLPEQGVTQTEAEGLNATLLDFHHDLTPEVAVRATAAAMSFGASALEATDDEEAFVEFGLNLTFGDGATANGSLRATHCASLDAE